MKRALPLLLLLTMAGWACAAETNNVDCDDNAASTTVVADVGSNGTLEGGDNTSAKSTTGPGNVYTLALDLNGTDDAIALAVNGHNASTTDSWSFWVNIDDFTGGVIVLGNTGNVRQLTLLSTTAVRVRTSTASSDFTVPAMSTGTWYNVLIVYEADNDCRVFLNGVESSTGTQNNGGLLSFTHIGRGQSAFMNGKIAGVRSWDSDESANVATIYAEGVASGGKPHVHYYQQLSQRAMRDYLKLSTPVLAIGGNY